jgi:hypothetical protein
MLLTTNEVQPVTDELVARVDSDAHCSATQAIWRPVNLHMSAVVTVMPADHRIVRCRLLKQ